jgi:hypothetical protein
MPKRKPQGSVRGNASFDLDQARCTLRRTRPTATSIGQCSLPSWFTNGLQPSFDTIQARAYASCLESVKPLPAPFVRLRLVFSSWQNSQREILEAKSPGPASIVKSAEGNRASNTLTGADGRHNGRSVSRQRTAVLHSWHPPKGRHACRKSAPQQPRARAKGKGSRGPRQKNHPGRGASITLEFCRLLDEPSVRRGKKAIICDYAGLNRCRIRFRIAGNYEMALEYEFLRFTDMCSKGN